MRIPVKLIVKFLALYIDVAPQVRQHYSNLCGESTALSPLPLIFSYKSEKSLCGTGLGSWRTSTFFSSHSFAHQQLRSLRGAGGGGSARSVISRAREEVMVDKLSAPIRRAALNESLKAGTDWRMQQEVLRKEIKAWPNTQMHSLMPVQDYF